MPRTAKERGRVFFRLVVRAPSGRAADPRGATVELRSGDKVVKTIRYAGEALAAVRGHADTKYSADFDAQYELRFAFKEPAILKIDAALVSLDVDGGSATLSVPIGVYEQKTSLRFPLVGDFMVVTGHGTTEGGHQERSQSFAYDVVGLGPHLELLRGDGTKNVDSGDHQSVSGRRVAIGTAGRPTSRIRPARRGKAQQPADGDNVFAMARCVSRHWTPGPKPLDKRTIRRLP